MPNPISPLYRRMENEAKKLRRNGATQAANDLFARASELRLAAKGTTVEQRAIGGMMETRKRANDEQLRLDREAQSQTTRPTVALESQNRGVTGAKPSVAPNSALASTPRPGARDFISKPSIDGNSIPDSIQRPSAMPAAKPSLAAQPREGLIDGKPASETLGRRNPLDTEPGDLADLRKNDAGSRQAAIDAARSGSSSRVSSPMAAARDRIDQVRKASGLDPLTNARPAEETLATRGSIIGGINKDRESKGMKPFGDDIYKDIAKADSADAASDRKFGSAFEVAQRYPATGIPTKGLSEYRAPYRPAAAPTAEKPTAEVVANPSRVDPAEGKGSFRRKDGSVPNYVVPLKLPLYAANSPSAKPTDDILTKRPWKRTY